MRACTHASLKEMMPNIWWDLPALSTLSGGQRPEAGGQSCQVQSLVFRLRPTFRMTTLVRNDWGEADTFLTNPNKKNDDGYSKMFFFVYSVFKYKTRRCAKVRVSRFHLCKIGILQAFNFGRFPDRLLKTQLKTSPKYKMIEIFSLLLRSMGLQLYEQIWRFTNLKLYFSFFSIFRVKPFVKTKQCDYKAKERKRYPCHLKLKEGDHKKHNQHLHKGTN